MMGDQLRILLLENIHPVAKETLEAEGFSVDLLTYAPAEEELIELLKNYQAVGIRSKSKINKNVIEQSSHLLSIGCFCIGTNQVDLSAAKKAGIAVFNAPHSNTRSVAELVIGEAIVLSRQLGDRSAKAHKGQWDKSAVGANEVRGKSMGIIGYGHIGTQVSILAEAMGFRVFFYDTSKKLPLGNATPLHTLDDLLETCDFVTLHVPELPSTKDMITKVQLAKMKKGAYLINASRGSVVIIEDLAEVLANHHLGGCAVDVFPVEPASNEEKFTSPLQGLDNVILTPHIGGSTEEAQHSIGLEVSESLRRYMYVGSSYGSVNVPNVDLSPREGCRRLLNIHRNEPGVLGEINNIISAAGANIDGQYLATDEEVGFLVMDVHADHVENLDAEISKLGRSVVTRIVF